MVEIFQVAVQAAQQQEQPDLAAAMQHASQMLDQLPENGSARIYARGLSQFAQQFRKYEVTLSDLLAYVQNLLGEDKEKDASTAKASLPSGAVLKALVSGLASWSQNESAQAQEARPLDMGALFELGMAYLQARQRGGTKAEILSDAAAAASPLGATPHRSRSGKLAIRALLQAMYAPE